MFSILDPAFSTRPRVFHQTPRFPPDPAFSSDPAFSTPRDPVPRTPGPRTPGPRPRVFHLAFLKTFAFVTRRPYCPWRPKKLCFTTQSLVPTVLTARLCVVKQSFFGLPGQYGRRVTKANTASPLIFSIIVSCDFPCTPAAQHLCARILQCSGSVCPVFRLLSIALVSFASRHCAVFSQALD